VNKLISFCRSKRISVRTKADVRQRFGFMSSRSSFSEASRRLLVLKTCQQIDVARRDRVGVALIANCRADTHRAVGGDKTRPLCFKLTFRLLFVVHASFYGCAHAGVGIERRSAVDLAAALDIELRDAVRDRDDLL
jgi:hypothetical protein